MDLFTITEIAEKLDCSSKTIYRLINRGLMPEPAKEIEKIGRGVRRFWASSEVEKIRKLVEDNKKFSPKKGRL